MTSKQDKTQDTEGRATRPSKPVGRPPIGEPVQVRLTADQLAQLDAWAAAHDMNRAAAIRELLRRAL